MKIYLKTLLQIRFWFFLLFYLFTNNAQAAVSATIMPDKISINDNVTLTITTSGTIDGSIDLSPLTQDFSVINQSQYTTLSMINGVTASQQKLILTLAPQKMGNLTIPSLTIGADKTPVLQVMVSADNSANKNTIQSGNAASTNNSVNNNSLQSVNASQILNTSAGPNQTPNDSSQFSAEQLDKLAFIEATISNDKPYVGEPILYTAHIFLTPTLADNLTQTGSFEPPTLNDITGKTVGKTALTRVTRQGQVYYLLTQRYLFTPTTKGDIQISPLKLSGTITVPLDPAMHQFDNPQALMDGVERPITVVAKPITLGVQAEATNAADWLPALNITLSQEWSRDPASAQVGQPITRTLTWRAVGADPARVPSFSETAVTGVNIYPDKMTESLNFTNDHLQLIRQQKIVYIPTQAGRLTLPVIQIPWWNTLQHKAEITQLPAQLLTVTGNVENANSANMPDKTSPMNIPPSTAINKAVAVPTNNVNQPTAPIMANTANSSAEGATSAKTSGPTPTLWVLTVSVLAALWILTMVAWWWQKHRVTHQQNSYRHWQRQLKLACRQNNALLAKQALLGCVQSIWPQRSLHTLGDIARQDLDSKLKTAILNLDQVLYAEESNVWDGPGFWQIYTRYMRQRPLARAISKTGLPPLYPLS